MSEVENQKNIPVRKVPRKVPRFLLEDKTALQKPFEFNPKQYKFLETFAETLDYKHALQLSGMSHGMVQKSQYVLSEIKKITQAAALKHRTKSAMGNHLRLMEKFERGYDGSGEGKVRVGYAGVLSRMSEAVLRAEGEFKEEKFDTTRPISISINLGDGVGVEAQIASVDVKYEVKEE